MYQHYSILKDIETGNVHLIVMDYHRVYSARRITKEEAIIYVLETARSLDVKIRITGWEEDFERL